jgi:signal transduction histidine kinase
VFQKIISYLGELLERPKKNKKLWQAGIFLVVITPIVFLCVFSFYLVFQATTLHLFQEKKATAYLSATILKEKLDKLIVVGESLATRPRLVEDLSAGKWQEAIQVLKNIPQDFPFIDHIFLSDVKGNFMADLPQTSEITGKNFSFRDWYKGVSSNWQPYVSEIYKRAIVPERNIVAIAVPVSDSLGNVLGILVLQVLPETFFEWVKGVDIGLNAFIYVVDRKGQIVFHPKIPAFEDIVDFSMIGSTREVLKGRSGVNIFYNPVEKEKGLVAYTPVSGYGWGVVVVQPVKYAFDQRNRGLAIIVAVYAIFLVLSFAFTYLILRISIERYQREQIVRELNVSLAQRNQELLVLNKELESFSYSVSHDLRAPLRSIDGFSSALFDDYSGSLDAQGKDCLQRVRKAAQNMNELIDDMLLLSRVTRKEIVLQPVNLSVMAQEIFSELQISSPERKVEIFVSPDMIVNADKGLLRIVLDNLINNAWKFSSRNPQAKIEFSFKEEQGKKIFFVRDNGAGFDMAYKDKLFNAFQRLHSGLEFPGTGIGLATAQRILHRHKGSIWAEAQVDKGAVFYFMLGGSNEGVN